MANPKTLYLIDDDNDDLDLFSEAVQTVDNSIVCIKFNDSEASLKSIRQKKIPIPDLIFLDLNMPMVSGRDFLAEIKLIEAYSEVPVIIYSTSSYAKDIREAQDLGAVYFLTKPYSFSELVSRLNDLLNRDWSASSKFLTY